MVRHPVALLEDMLAEILFLQEATTGKDLEDMLDDETLRRSMERSLEILGEAAKTVPADIRGRYPSIPWQDMTDMRNVLIHAYHKTEPSLVWRAARDHAIPLRGALEAAVADERSRMEGPA